MQVQVLGDLLCEGPKIPLATPRGVDYLGSRGRKNENDRETRPVIAAALVLEYEATCIRLLSALNLTADEIRELLDYLCNVGKLSAIRFRVRPSVADPDDELVLEAAIATGSEWIVTHNIRDMAAGAARYGIEAIRPGEALRRLGVEQ